MPIYTSVLKLDKPIGTPSHQVDGKRLFQTVWWLHQSQ